MSRLSKAIRRDLNRIIRRVSEESSPTYVWRDISTMPTEGDVWIYSKYTELMCISRYSEVVLSGEYSEATHWCNLPDAPKL